MCQENARQFTGLEGKGKKKMNKICWKSEFIERNNSTLSADAVEWLMLMRLRGWHGWGRDGKYFKIPTDVAGCGGLEFTIRARSNISRIVFPQFPGLTAPLPVAHMVDPFLHCLCLVHPLQRWLSIICSDGWDLRETEGWWLAVRCEWCSMGNYERQIKAFDIKRLVINIKVVIIIITTSPVRSDPVPVYEALMTLVEIYRKILNFFRHSRISLSPSTMGFPSEHLNFFAMVKLLMRFVWLTGWWTDTFLMEFLADDFAFRGDLSETRVTQLHR